MSSHIVAAIQMTSTDDKSTNLETARHLVTEAANQGAQLVALPELFNCLAQPETIVANSEPIPGPTSELMSELAKKLQITLLAGSFAERSEGEKIYNTSLLFGPDGDLLAKYRKLHLFDIDLPGEVTFQESNFMCFGDRIAVTDTEVGRLGQATCYDLRFPELFRILVEEGAEIMVIPAAFTMATGRDHWELLLRARAIENQCFVVAPNQFGHHGANLHSFGRSMIIDPWGTVLAKAADGSGVTTAEIDFEQLARVRRHLPCLQHRRPLDQFSAAAKK